jgi:CubicO group peptidase (beta-lactamase class C family)
VVASEAHSIQGKINVTEMTTKPSEKYTRGPRRALLVLGIAVSASLGLACGTSDGGSDAISKGAMGQSASSAYTVTPGAAWVARHGLTSAEYQAEFDSLVRKGYRLTYVSGYAVNNQPLFAAIWEKSNGPAWVARHGLTSAQYQQEFNTQAANGYRLVLVNGYTVNNQDRYVALWDKSPSGAWIARHGMSASQYQTEFNTHVAQGYRLTHVSGYTVNGNSQQTFAAIWEKKGGPAWVARHGLTAAEYQAEFDTQARAGYHLTLVGGYPVGSDVRYVAIWEQGAVVPWEAHHGLSSSGYQQTFDDLRYQGYRPVVVSGYGVGGTAGYAALWENFSYSGAELGAIDRVVNGAMAQYSVPGLSLSITDGGRLVFAKAYGLADQGAGTKVNTSSLFRIASVTKPITSTAIQLLKEAGTLKYDDKVFGSGAILGTTFGTQPYGRWITDITVRELLTHTAGGWPNDGSDPMFSNPSLNQDQLISWTLDNRPLANAPGTAYAYSNFGYCILGRVIEKLTGQPYDAWVKAHVLAPAGITDMQVGGNTLAQRKPNEVVYYSASSPSDPYSMQVSRMDSHGGWIATPIDLVRFAVRVDGYASPPDLLQAGTLGTMTTGSSANPGYAMGWAVNSVPNWWHGGSLPGTTSEVVRTSKTGNNPATPNGITWGVITNSRDNGPDVDTMMWNIMKAGIVWPGYDLF